MIKKYFFSILLNIICFFIACGESGGGGVSSGQECTEEDLFSISPIALDHIRGLVPLGQLNPTGHTFPTRHLYFYVTLDDSQNPLMTDLMSPGNIQITHIQSSEHLSEDPVVTDYSLYFSLCSEITGYFKHVSTLSSSLQQAFDTAIDNEDCETYSTGGSTFRTCSAQTSLIITAGENLGTTQGLDFGLRDSRITLDFINPARHIDDSLHVACPVDYYTENTQASLEALFSSYDGTIPRTTDPVCGQVAWDVEGTVQGLWFSDETSTLDDGEDSHLTLAYDNIDPSQGAFSVGNALPTLSSGVYLFEPVSEGLVNRFFGEISVDENIYCYDTGEIAILIQLMSESVLAIEGLEAENCEEGSFHFTGNQTLFYR